MTGKHANFKIQLFTKIYSFLILVFFGLQNCTSYKVKEIEPEDILEEELRADPEGYRSRDIKEKELKKTPNKK